MGGNCDWAALGIGAQDDVVEGDISYCCSADTAARGICTASDIGKLILDPVLFTGEQRTVEVPTPENTEFAPKEPVFEITKTGDYVLLMGNCYDHGLEVLELGTMEWKSVRGYLPYDIYGLMLFYAGATCFYLLLVVWYWCG